MGLECGSAIFLRHSHWCSEWWSQEGDFKLNHCHSILISWHHSLNKDKSTVEGSICTQQIPLAIQNWSVEVWQRLRVICWGFRYVVNLHVFTCTINLPLAPLEVIYLKHVQGGLNGTRADLRGRLNYLSKDGGISYPQRTRF